MELQEASITQAIPLLIEDDKIREPQKTLISVSSFQQTSPTLITTKTSAITQTPYSTAQQELLDKKSEKKEEENNKQRNH